VAHHGTALVTAMPPFYLTKRVITKKIEKDRITIMTKIKATMEGPLNKSIYTIQLETLTRKLMAPTCVFKITTDSNKNTLVTVDGETYNLTALISGANFEHIEFNDDDFELYQAYLQHGNCTEAVPELKSYNEAVYLHHLYGLGTNASAVVPNNPISFSEMQAINVYTSNFYQPMNELLRYGRCDDDRLRPAIIHSMMCASGLRKIPTVQITESYRAVDLDEREYGNYMASLSEGKPISIRGFVSSSYGRIPYAFSDRSVEIHFTNLRGAYIAPIAKALGEQEFLIPPTSIKVTGCDVTSSGLTKFDAVIAHDVSQLTIEETLRHNEEMVAYESLKNQLVALESYITQNGLNKATFEAIKKESTVNIEPIQAQLIRTNALLETCILERLNTPPALTAEEWIHLEPLLSVYVGTNPAIIEAALRNPGEIGPMIRACSISSQLEQQLISELFNSNTIQFNHLPDNFKKNLDFLYSWYQSNPHLLGDLDKATLNELFLKKEIDEKDVPSHLLTYCKLHKLIMNDDAQTILQLNLLDSGQINQEDIVRMSEFAINNNKMDSFKLLLSIKGPHKLPQKTVDDLLKSAMRQGQYDAVKAILSIKEKNTQNQQIFNALLASATVKNQADIVALILTKLTDLNKVFEALDDAYYNSKYSVFNVIVDHLCDNDLIHLHWDAIKYNFNTLFSAAWKHGKSEVIETIIRKLNNDEKIMEEFLDNCKPLIPYLRVNDQIPDELKLSHLVSLYDALNVSSTPKKQDFLKLIKESLIDLIKKSPALPESALTKANSIIATVSEITSFAQIKEKLKQLKAGGDENDDAQVTQNSP
jgi:hypothetical protein